MIDLRFGISVSEVALEMFFMSIMELCKPMMIWRVYQNAFKLPLCFSFKLSLAESESFLIGVRSQSVLIIMNWLVKFLVDANIVH